MMGRYDTYLEHLENRIPHLSAAEAQQTVHHGAVLIDVREPDEFAVAHIPSAINLPRFRLESRIEEVVQDPQARIVVYCGSRGRSTIAAATLREVGWDAAVLRGGLQAWVAAGLPVKAEPSL